jgi:hypothetical protein
VRADSEMLHMRVSKGTADMWRAIAQARLLRQSCLPCLTLQSLHIYGSNVIVSKCLFLLRILRNKASGYGAYVID